MRHLHPWGRLTALATLATLTLGADLSAQNQFQETLYLASDGAAGDGLGGRLSTAGDVTAIRQINWDNRTIEIGTVYVVEGCNQAQETQLQGSNLVPSDMFATSVATDGKLIVVGAPQTDTLTLTGAGGPGKVYVFRRTPGGWVEEAILVPSNGGPDHAFGYSVDVDGDLIAVGAPGKNSFGGSVYLYRFDGSQWNEEGEVAVNTQPNRFSGLFVSCCGDTVVTGNHPTAPFFAPTALVGSAIAARRTGNTWQEFRILSPNGTFFGQFGLGVTAGEDRIVIGAPGRVGEGLPGEAYVFDYTGGQFTLTGTLNASDGMPDDYFGYDVGISGDLIAVSAFFHDNSKGAIYLYRLDNGNWVEDQKIMASDGAADDRLGAQLDFAGGRIAASSPGNDDNGQDAGSVYFFSSPLFRSYGSGLAGTGGLVPTLTATGNTQAGSTITLQGRNFVGGAPTILYVGLERASIPQYGGTLLVDLMGGAQAIRTLQGPIGVAGMGSFDFNAQVPALLECRSVFFQQWALDPAAPGFVSMSNGLEIYLVD